MRHLSVFLGAALAASCSSPSTTTDAGSDAGNVYVAPIINVSGTVTLHPTLVNWYQGQTFPAPSVTGRQLIAQEPLLAIEKNPGANLATIDSLPGDGGTCTASRCTFTFTQINTAKIVLGLIALLRDGWPVYLPGADGGVDGGSGDASTAAADGGSVIPAGYAQFPDSVTTLVQGKPQADITGAKVYAFTYDFVAYLDGIMNLSGAQELVTQGFIFGLVVDANGNPVSGATIHDVSGQVPDSQITYFNDALTAVSSTQATSANGVFVIANAGASGTPPNFEVLQGGTPNSAYPKHLGGSQAGSVFQLVMAPQ